MKNNQKNNQFNIYYNIKQLNARYSQAGVGLIEVLVAILLLSMSILGAVALQFASAKEQRSSQFLSRAGLIASEMAERMRSNRAGMQDATQYMTSNVVATVQAAMAIAKTATPSPACTAAQPCTTPANTANYDQIMWWKTLLTQMPSDTAGLLLMPTGGTGNMVARDIVIMWREPVVDKDGNGNTIIIPSNQTGCPTTLLVPTGMRCYVQRVML